MMFQLVCVIISSLFLMALATPRGLAFSFIDPRATPATPVSQEESRQRERGLAGVFLPRALSPTRLAAETTSTVPSNKAEQTNQLGAPICEYHTVQIPTSLPGPPQQSISVEDLTPTIRRMLKASGMQQGVVNVLSRHTTTAVTINERESRLAQDLQDWLIKLAPPDERSEPAVAVEGVRYKHNDIDQRPESDEEAERCRENGWNIDDPQQLDAWRAQEPINAHSHLISMLLGSSESIPVVDGNMVIGQVRSCGYVCMSCL
jgi:thiamine phosphate synthase YjbQ (UPF0047 family)